MTRARRTRKVTLDGIEGFFFLVGVQQVGEEEGIAKYTLSSNDHHPHPKPRFLDGHERHKMHPLVLRFLKQRLNPTSFFFKFPQRFEMTEHSSDHPRNPGNSLEKQNSQHPILFCHLDGLRCAFRSDFFLSFRKFWRKQG